MPSSARLIASIAYSRAGSGRAWRYGSSICTTSAPGRLQVAQLLVHGVRVREREAPAVGVVVVLRLLRHRERPGNGDLDPAVRDRAQELDVTHLDRPRAADRADDSRDGVLVAGAVERDAGLVQVDPVERRREAVRVALPAHLPVGDHVDSRALHVRDRKPRRVVLGVLEKRLGYPPQLERAHAGRQPRAEPLAVDQPVGLRIAPDDGREKSRSRGHSRASLRRACRRRPRQAPRLPITTNQLWQAAWGSNFGRAGHRTSRRHARALAQPPHRVDRTPPSAPQLARRPAIYTRWGARCPDKATC